MSKKLTALLLALAMMLTMLSGCSGTDAPAADETEEPAASDENAESTQDAETADTEDAGLVLEEIPQEAYDDPISYVTDGAIKKDDVVATVNGLEVKADLYFNWLTTVYVNMAYNYYYYGMELDVNEVLDEENGTTVADYFVDQAAMMAQMYTLVREKAKDAGLDLTDAQKEELAGLSENYTAESTMYYIITVEGMQQAYTDSQLIITLRDHLYGEGGELEPTEDTLADFVSANGNYNCRYILQRTDELEEDDTEGRAAKQQQAQDLYDQLLEVPADELEAKFIELQAEYNDDGNTEEFAFDATTSLVSGFREKLAEMEDGQIGLTEETDYGYFVILRLPVDLDSVKDTYVDEAYNTVITEWMDNAETELSGALISLDAEACFEKLIALQTVVANELSAQAEAEAAEAEESVEAESADTEG
ncbi:MAG: hypothetical protein IJX71_03825 [Oscillospiraceae bacterium]|nr:hypothetical protein [Oscillospiraceae bacterium]